MAAKRRWGKVVLLAGMAVLALAGKVVAQAPPVYPYGTVVQPVPGAPAPVYVPGQPLPPSMVVPGQPLPPPGQPLPPGYAPPGQPAYVAPGQPVPPGYVVPGQQLPPGYAAPVQAAPKAPPQATAPQPAPQPAAASTVAEISFIASANMNPDASGRPSPVIVRTYELKSLNAFNGADFFSVFDREKEVMGPDLIARDEWPLTPGVNRQAIKNLQKDTRYVGVVAAFRDVQRAQWRAATLILPNQTSRVQITIDRNEVNVRLF